MGMSEEGADDEASTIEAIHALLAANSDGEALTAVGFSKALIGSAEGWFDDSRRIVALYDYARCVEILMSEGMDELDALEWMDNNVLGAYVGPSTPLFAIIYRQPTLTDPTED
jgi:hypothetical protein